MILVLIAALSLGAQPQKPDCNAMVKQAEAKCADSCAKKARRQYQNANKQKQAQQGAPASCEAACEERVAMAKDMCKKAMSPPTRSPKGAAHEHAEGEAP